MNRTKDRTDSSLDLELYFCTEILELKSLHYGYWDEPQSIDLETIDLDNIRQAQARYTDTLIDLIPAGVETILDVGCGTGDVDKTLIAHGYKVTAISPDHNHAKFFRGHTNGVLQFHNTPFELFDGNDRNFDLMLMSESQNYIDAEITFSKARRFLRPGGHLLISGMFRKNESAEYTGNYVEDSYLSLARSHGFRLVQRIDISENTLPTIAYANRVQDKYLQPTWGMVDHFLGDGGQFKLKMLRLLFSGEFRRLERARDRFDERFDAALFSQRIQYVRLLFQAPQAE